MIDCRAAKYLVSALKNLNGDAADLVCAATEAESKPALRHRPYQGGNNRRINRAHGVGRKKDVREMDAHRVEDALAAAGPVAAIDGASPAVSPPSPVRAETTTYGILAALSLSHLLNDLIQSLVPAMYPLLKTSFALISGRSGSSPSPSS